MTFLRTPSDQRRWQWICSRWTIAYRTRRVVFDVLSDQSRTWFTRGEGRALELRRIIDLDHGNNPHDLEIVQVHFDYLGRLKGCTRRKSIVVETGRSHADLCRMLGIDEVPT